MLLAKHIFFEVAHHVPICGDFYRLNQPTARHLLNTYYKNIHHPNLHDKCMITIFCHQINFVVHQPHKTNLATTYTAPQHHSTLLFFYQLLSSSAAGLVFIQQNLHQHLAQITIDRQPTPFFFLLHATSLDSAPRCFPSHLTTMMAI